MLSIIIPAFNEEKLLPLLFDSLKNQDFKDYEAILADAGSADRTVEIAKSAGCKVVPGGLPGKGRNEGAKAANGDILFFLDADAILPDRFFSSALKEFSDRGLGIAGFNIKPYPRNVFIEFLVDIFYNRMMIVAEKILPHASMGILVKKSVFEKINGFDESIKLAEDHDFARRAAKVSKFGVIRSVKLFTSDRRAKADGWLPIVIKFFLCELHMIFIGPVRSDFFKYRFGHYDKKR